MLTLWLLACSTPGPAASAPPIDARSPPPAPSAPSPAAPTWRGTHCAADSDCVWDSCLRTACIGANATAVHVPCEESAPSPGSCTCAESQCTLRLDDAKAGNSAPGCKSDSDCAIDLGTGTCHLGGDRMVGPITTTGEYCACNNTSTVCEPVWLEPIPCTSWKDCDVERLPRLRPIKADPPRTKKVKACEDSSVDAICSPAGFCEVVAWSC